MSKETEKTTEKDIGKNPHASEKLVERLLLRSCLIPFLIISIIPRRARKEIANTLRVIGVLLFIGTGLYMIFLEVSYFYARWGFFGFLLGIFPPIAIILSSLFPFVFWVMEGIFPTFYFIIWVVGIVSAITTFVIAELLSSEK